MRERPFSDRNRKSEGFGGGFRDVPGDGEYKKCSQLGVKHEEIEI